VRGWVFVFVFALALAAMTAEDAASEVVSRDLCMSAFRLNITEATTDVDGPASMLSEETWAVVGERRKRRERTEGEMGWERCK
jgi:hypothetical protein